MISEDSSFTGASWVAFLQNISFTLSGGFGVKTIYAKIKNATTETVAVNDTITVVDENALTLNSISINSGDANTGNGTVMVAMNVTGTPTHYRLGETADLSAVAWIAWASTAQFILSAGYGAKTIYAEVKNDSHTVGPVSDTITFVQPVVLTSVVINSGDSSTTSQAISIALSYTGTPTHYKISEASDLAGASWVAFSASPISFNLSSGNATKNVYVKLMNSVSESSTVSDSIVLNIVEDATTAVISLTGQYANSAISYPVNGAGKTLNVYAPSSGSYTAKQLKSTAGVLLSWYAEMNSTYYPISGDFSASGPMLSQGTAGNPTLSGDTGPYEDSYLAKNWHPGVSPSRFGRLVFTLPVGTYKFKVIWSTTSGYSAVGYESDLFYRVDVNGVAGTPVLAGASGFSAIANNGFNSEIDITVDALNTANVVFVAFATTGVNYRPGINLLEIIKLS